MDKYETLAALMIFVALLCVPLFLMLYFHPTPKRTILGRFRTMDVAYTYRMLAGLVGVITRLSPQATVEPVLWNPTTPPTAYGQPTVIDAATQSARALTPADSGLTDVYGITVRPFPYQIDQAAAGSFGASGFGGGSPPAGSVGDVLKRGYILVTVSGPTVPAKGGQAYVWVAATSGANVQNTFVATATSGSTITLPSSVTFNGPPDANGVGELCFRA